ncbi:MAG: hypothetical protein HQK77_01095 [Desulfobacterales bacterium]|nr:hypothetical protein [Desulfobacterales bacterium]
MQNHEINVQDLNIEDLIPHRNGMKLIERIISVTEEMAITQSVVNTAWPFFDSDSNSTLSLIVIELVAQTAGVSNGLDRIRTFGFDSKKEGWIVGIKNASFFIDKISLHQTIITRTETHFKYEKFREVAGTSYSDDMLIGEVTLQLFQVS